MLEILMDPLGVLVITFMVMSLVSVAGLILLFAAKSEKLKKGLFHFLAVWGVVIAFCNVMGIPEMWTGQIVLALMIGALSVIGLLVQHLAKNENRFKIARILVAISVVAGMIDCFML